MLPRIPPYLSIYTYVVCTALSAVCGRGHRWSLPEEQRAETIASLDWWELA